MLSTISKHLKGDRHIWFIYLLISILSSVVVYSAVSALAFKNTGGIAEFYLLKHVFFLFFGFVIMFFVQNIDITKYLGLLKLLLFFCPVLMVYTLLYGHSVGGAKRWILILGQTIQSSDIVRLVLITNLSAMLARKQNVSYSQKDLIPMLLWIGVLVLLIAISSFSTSIILGITCLVIMWIGRVPKTYLLTILGFIVGLVFLSIAGGVLIKKYDIVEIGRFGTVVDRVEVFINKDLDDDNFIGGPDGKNSNQKSYGLVAVASGGVFGVGPGNSAMKNVLPDAFSDFIYSIICEEYGLFGGFVVLSLFIWLLYRGLYNVNNTQRAFTGLLSVGLTVSIVLQAFAHMLINVGLVPVTGQTLPLFSQGGTAIIFNCIALGIVLSVTKTEPNI